MPPVRIRIAVRLAAAWLALAGAAVPAQISSAPISSAPPSSTPIPAGELVRLVVANEVAAANSTAIKHMFRSRKQTPKGSQTRLYVETDDAMAGMLIALNDQPLTPAQQQGERDHLAGLMNNPDMLRKKKAREKDDADRTLQIVKALPNVFRYEYAGTQMGEADFGKAGRELLRLNFTPDPAYSPPSRVEQVLTGLKGYLLIDAASRRLAFIDGALFKDVTFGWGLIGRLDKGGHFRVRQAEVSEGAWDITEMDLSITGKILLFKSLSMVSDEVFSDYRRVPDKLTFAQGVEMLAAEREKPAHAAAPSEAKKTQ